MQLIEKSLGLLQVKRVETLGEPAIDRSEKIARLIPLTLIAPQPRHAHRRTQFPGLCLLLPRNRERTFEICFRFRCIRLRRPERDFPGYAMDFCLAPRFLCCVYCIRRFADAAPSVIIGGSER